MRPTMANPDVHRAWRGHAGTWGCGMRTNGRQSTRRWRRGTAGALRSEALVEEATAPACVLDRGGRIIVANHALEQLLGVAAGGLGGRTLPSLAYPPDEELANAAVQQVLSEGLDRCQVEGRWVRVFSRELVWGSWDLSLVRDRRGRPELAIAMVRDLTAMKRSEHERRFFQFMFKLIGEADSSHQVLSAAVQTICHFTRCAMGQVWLPGRRRARLQPHLELLRLRVRAAARGQRGHQLRARPGPARAGLGQAPAAAAGRHPRL